MGTRSLTRINTTDGDKIINLYRQFDGYPSGHGRELFEFLNGFEIVNGYSGSEGPKAANGAGCLAAQLVTHFKGRSPEIANLKAALQAALKEDDQALRAAVQDHEYVVTVDETTASLKVEVFGYEGIEFTGSVEEFGAFCSREEAS